MTVRHAEAHWVGSLKQGTGKLRLGSGVFEGAYSFPSRFEDGPGTNPEELIAAAHAGCFSMALAYGLGAAGFDPSGIHTTAKVHLGMTGAGPTITRIELETEGDVPGIDALAFAELAATAKQTCLVSRALAGISDVRLNAKLVESLAA